jgi:hypothetical protein
MKSKFHDKAAKDKGFAKWENEKPTVQAGVDVVDRGTAFEPDQDDGQDEAKQGGEVSAVNPWLPSGGGGGGWVCWYGLVALVIASWLQKHCDQKSRCMYSF